MDLIKHSKIVILLSSFFLFINNSFCDEFNLNGGVTHILLHPAFFIETEYEFNNQAIRANYFKYIDLIDVSSHEYNGASFNYAFNLNEKNGIGKGFYVSVGKTEISHQETLEEGYRFFGVGYEIYEKRPRTSFKKHFIRAQFNYYKLEDGSRLLNEGNYSFKFPSIFWGVGF